MDDNRRRIVAWVGAEVMPYEAGVRAWLRRSMVAGDDIDDLIQEAYCKLAALDSIDHIERPDGYFFHVVRMLLADRVRRSRIVRIETVSEIDQLPVWSDEPSPEQVTAARRDWARVQALINSLPERCRRIFILRKIDGLSQREIAARLGVSESVVENDGAKGLRLIIQAMRTEEGTARPEGKRRHARNG